MDRLFADRRLAGVAVVALLLLALVGQAATDTLSPTGIASTGRTVGRAAFAYVTGLRTFAAAVLWNRLEPQLHEYYDGRSLRDQTFLMPSIRAVVALDPQFEQAYYVGSWMLASRGRVKDGVALADEAVRNNPSSGHMRMSHAQMVFVFEKDPQRAGRIGKTALEAEWTDVAEAFEGFRVLMAIFKAADMPEEYAAAERVYDRVKALPEAAGFDLDHDHDGDGKPDH